MDLARCLWPAKPVGVPPRGFKSRPRRHCKPPTGASLLAIVLYNIVTNTIPSKSSSQYTLVEVAICEHNTHGMMSFLRALFNNSIDNNDWLRIES